MLTDARDSLRRALIIHCRPDSLDPVTREVLAAGDAIDRARRILREGGR